MKFRHYVFFIVSFIPVFVYNATVIALLTTIEDYSIEAKRLEAGGKMFTLGGLGE